MGVKRGVNKKVDRVAWRGETSTENIRAMLSSPDVITNLESNPDVLRDLELSLGFLELLKEMKLYGSPAWKSADKAYHTTLDEKIKRGEDVDKFTARYYQMFRLWVDNIPRQGEDFHGEFNELVKHAY